MSMLPAATSCRCGFQKCVRVFSISVTCALLPLPSLSPRRVASSSPPAPPPTMTMRCSAGGGECNASASRAPSVAGAASRFDIASGHLDGQAGVRRGEHQLGIFRVLFRLVVEHALHPRGIELAAPLADG